MKINKMSLTISILAVLVLLVSACGVNATTVPEAKEPAAGESVAEVAPAGKQIQVCAVFNGMDHPSSTAMRQGFDDESPKFNVKVTSFDPAQDPQKQAAMIEDCISAKPDVIAVNVVDPAAVVSSLKKVYDADIPLLTFNATTNAEGKKYIKTFIGSESYSQGYAVGQMMVAKFGDKDTQVIFIGGNPGQIDYVNRVQGAKDAWADAGVTYTVIADQPAAWNKDKAMALMQDLLTRFPSGKIDAVYAVDDPMAMGALIAMKAADRLGEIAIYGTNGNKDACDALKKGELAGTALQMSYLVGVYTIRAAYDIVNGRLVMNPMLAPTAPLTPDNIDQWYSSCW
jgi:ribose transport system substrate-binding protein